MMFDKVKLEAIAKTYLRERNTYLFEIFLSPKLNVYSAIEEEDLVVCSVTLV